MSKISGVSTTLINRNSHCESLMQVQVTDVAAAVSRVSDTDLRVKIRACPECHDALKTRVRD
jgi:hypothetical protein